MARTQTTQQLQERVIALARKRRALCLKLQRAGKTQKEIAMFLGKPGPPLSRALVSKLLIQAREDEAKGAGAP